MEEIVSINGLSFAFPDGCQALSEIGLTIHRGETVALIGPNGAGKSTLLLHLNGLLSANGHIRIFSQTPDDSNIKAIRARVGLVFQNPDDQLFSATVFDDVAFGPINLGWAEDEVRQSVKRALASVGLSGYERRSPHHLSLGEKKRVAIATVLSTNPELLVMDEPTSNLDPAAQWQLIKLLRDLRATKVIATHDLRLASAICSRTILMYGGRIVADGPTGSLLRDTRLLAAHGMAAVEEPSPT